jgi:hypothetical protein
MVLGLSNTRYSEKKTVLEAEYVSILTWNGVEART